MRKRTLAAWGVAGVLGVVLAVEAAVRLSGMLDFPLYLADPELGYLIAPGQHGNFLHRHRWEFNEISLGTGPFRPEGRRNVLLLGDSLVLGGNPLNQSDRLGPTLERKLGAPWAVWPSGAQSWSAANEATYLRRSPQVVDRAEWLVWVLNNGDFQGRSVWRSDLLNPRHRPLWGGLYVFEKYVWMGKLEMRLPSGFPLLVPVDPETFLPRDRLFPDFQEFVRGLRRDRPGLHVCIVWYPEVAELHPPTGDFFPRMSDRLRAFASEAGVSFVDLAQESGWSAADYRDMIHPSPAGSAAFARIVGAVLEKTP